MDHFGQGLIASTYDARDYKIVADKEFPTSFELNTVPVKNQGGTCSCVAFATSYIIEFHNKKQTENYREFSTEFIYGLRDVGHMIGTGMMLRNALSILRNMEIAMQKIAPAITNMIKQWKLCAQEKMNLKILRILIELVLICVSTEKLISKLH